MDSIILQNNDLKRENADLKARLAVLESAVSKIASTHSQPITPFEPCPPKSRKRHARSAAPSPPKVTPVTTANRFDVLSNTSDQFEDMDEESVYSDSESSRSSHTVTPTPDIPEVRAKSQPSTKQSSEWPALPVKAVSQPPRPDASVRTQVSRRSPTLALNADGLYVLKQPVQSTPTVVPDPQPTVVRPPPIVIRGNGLFTTVKKLADQNHIAVREYKDGPEGLKVFTETSEGFRALRNIFEASQLPFHLFQLKEEKELRIVLRGVPQEVEIEEVENDLKERGYEFSSVHRMKRGTTVFPMVLITAPKTEGGRRCFDIVHILQKRVTAEPKRKPVGGSQCYKCQRFGHVSARCFGEIRCAFCLEVHPSTECPNERGPGLAAQCVNCKGNHPSFSRQCPQHPLALQARRDALRQAKLDSASRRDNVSYAQTAGGNPPSDQSLHPALLQQIKIFMESTLKQMLPSLIRSINGN